MTPAEIIFSVRLIELLNEHFTAVSIAMYCTIAAWFVLRLIAVLKH